MRIAYHELYTGTVLHTQHQTSVPALRHLVAVTTVDGRCVRYRVAAVQWPLDLRQGPEAEQVVQVFVVEVGAEENTQ